MSDPRQEERLKVQAQQNPPGYLPTQVLERIAQSLSPADDLLPFAQAVRHKEDMDKAAKAFRNRMKGRE
jgi:hypothetical protein